VRGSRERAVLSRSRSVRATLATLATAARDGARGGRRPTTREVTERLDRRTKRLGGELTVLNAEQERARAAAEGARAAAEGARALAALALERTERWPERLAELRASPAWARAYTEDEPLVTVRIATYNRAVMVCERALESVRRQGYEHWEAVVVGDACTDDTAERIAALGDPRITFHNLPARGPYPDDPYARWLVAGIPPMNAATARASGAWIAPLDDDDEWSDDHLEVLLAVARDREAELAYGRLRGRMQEPPIEITLGSWPPRQGAFGFQAAVYNAALADFRYEMACRFLGEPGDWNLARRMWEAGVRFTFVDHVVATWYRDRPVESEIQLWRSLAEAEATSTV
jgi:hypothetical protein